MRFPDEVFARTRPTYSDASHLPIEPVGDVRIVDGHCGGATEIDYAIDCLAHGAEQYLLVVWHAHVVLAARRSAPMNVPSSAKATSSAAPGVVTMRLPGHAAA